MGEAADPLKRLRTVAARLARVTAIASRDRPATPSATACWVVLPAVGAAIYALVGGRFFSGQNQAVPAKARRRGKKSHRQVRLSRRSQESPRDSGGGIRSYRSHRPARIGFEPRDPSRRRRSSSPSRRPKSAGPQGGGGTDSGRVQRKGEDRSRQPYEEHLALRATLDNMLDVTAGAHASTSDDVGITVNGVETETLLHLQPVHLKELVDRAESIFRRHLDG